MTYQPPKHILEVMQKIDFEEALEPDDPRFVPTEQARGAERTQKLLARKLGLSLSDGVFFPNAQKHILFFGHTGSGKTTELKRYQRTLAGPERFYVVEVDITNELDRNNLQYSDVLMAMARRLIQRLQDDCVPIDLGASKALEDWFSERVRTEDRSDEFSAAIQTGAKAKTGLPFLGELFASFTTAFRSNATYKESMRMVVRNTFTQFAEAFNRFLGAAEQVLEARGRGRRVLFVIDGTDKLRSEDTRRFFVEDAEQLLAIQALVVYVAPLALKYEGRLTHKLDADLVLPMIKLAEADDQRCDDGWNALREIILRRADRGLFANAADIERIIEFSGGHPRDLLRLLKLACEYAEDNQIDGPAVDNAIKKLASEYRRFLEPGDYATLVAIDQDRIYAGNDERTRRLLYNLAVLEYNDGSWRRSHPVIRLLEGYILATQPAPGPRA